MKASSRSMADVRSRSGEAGATMVEYALMVALIAVLVASGASVLGSSVTTAFDTAARSINGVAADEPAQEAEPFALPAQGAAEPAPAAGKQPKAPKRASGKSAEAPGHRKRAEAP